jgi:thioesterase domain-containing protein/acyl carrier protein
MTTSTQLLNAPDYVTPTQALAQLQRPAGSAKERDAVLAALLAIWQTIFDRPDVTETDDFFLLGGHSLKALQLQVHVRSALDYEMDLRCLFDAPTVGELADYIVAHQASAAPDETAEAPSASNRGFHLRLANLDAQAWERCANQVVERHESLRALLSTVDGVPRLRILPYQPFMLSFVDLSAAEDAEREAEQRLIADLAAPFDLNVGPLYRFGGFQVTPEHTLVSLTVAPGIGEADLPRATLREMLSLYPSALTAPAAEAVQSPSVPVGQAAIDRNEAAAECLVPLHREGTRLPFFIVAGVGGGTMNFRAFALALSPDQPVYGVQAKGYSTKSMPLNRVEAMAAYYIEAIRAVQPTGPYYLFGYSFGGMPALEMAQQLRAQGETVALLGILDTLILGRHGKQSLTLAGPGVGPFVSRVGFRLREMLTISPGELPAYLKTRWKFFRARTRKIRQVQTHRHLEAEGKDIPDELKKIRAVSELASSHYVPQPYPGKITLFQSQAVSDIKKATQLQNWTRLAGGGLDLVKVPGDHISMLRGENAVVLAQAVEAYMAAKSL